MSCDLLVSGGGQPLVCEDVGEHLLIGRRNPFVDPGLGLDGGTIDLGIVDDLLPWP